MEMRRSKVLDKLRAGEVVSCIKLNLYDSRVIEIAALSGMDCVWSDMEHVPNDFSAVEKQILAAKAYNTDILVRVSRGSYSDLIKPMEMDASGIMIPHIMSLADAKNVVKMTRFHPLGRRPIDGGNADGAFGNIDLCEYIKQANERRFVCIQIEDPEPLDELEEIAALDGIDMLFFGPGDFSQGIGAPGQWDHHELLKARKRVAAVALEHGKFAGTVGSMGSLTELISLGYRFINMGADVLGLGQYFTGIVSNFKTTSNATHSVYGEKI
ncbi:MAG: aldolase/citrate lyase family protein [Prolixibacteraceae bacterium]|jgi:4-hydroxy-2-oxoheptanedioate aldolase|nr:aldolase/citrate lyase family protein [Prolixibacteraceae bacterium]